jgi:hypothetical protein
MVLILIPYQVFLALSDVGYLGAHTTDHCRLEVMTSSGATVVQKDCVQESR